MTRGRLDGVTNAYGEAVFRNNVAGRLTGEKQRHDCFEGESDGSSDRAPGNDSEDT